MGVQNSAYSACKSMPDCLNGSWAFLKPSNKALLSFLSLSKSSFTPIKLRFFEFREPKNSSCYTASNEKVIVRRTCWTTTFLWPCVGEGWLERVLSYLKIKNSSCEVIQWAQRKVLNSLSLSLPHTGHTEYWHCRRVSAFGSVF